MQMCTDEFFSGIERNYLPTVNTVPNFGIPIAVHVVQLIISRPPFHRLNTFSFSSNEIRAVFSRICCAKVSAAVWLIAFVFCSFQFGLFVARISFRFVRRWWRWCCCVNVGIRRRTKCIFELKTRNFFVSPCDQQSAASPWYWLWVGPEGDNKNWCRKFRSRSGGRNKFSRLLLRRHKCWTNNLRLLKLWMILFLKRRARQEVCSLSKYRQRERTGNGGGETIKSDSAEQAIETLIQINSLFKFAFEILC